MQLYGYRRGIDPDYDIGFQFSTGLLLPASFAADIRFPVTNEIIPISMGIGPWVRAGLGAGTSFPEIDPDSGEQEFWPADQIVGLASTLGLGGDTFYGGLRLEYGLERPEDGFSGVRPFAFGGLALGGRTHRLALEGTAYPYRGEPAFAAGLSYRLRLGPKSSAKAP